MLIKLFSNPLITLAGKHDSIHEYFLLHMYLITFHRIPGASVVRTLCFHCHGPGSIPGGGTKIESHVTQPK